MYCTPVSKRGARRTTFRYSNYSPAHLHNLTNPPDLDYKARTTNNNKISWPTNPYFFL